VPHRDGDEVNNSTYENHWKSVFTHSLSRAFDFTI
jgi:hypothetical protein